jgi:uncharacterized protein YceK
MARCSLVLLVGFGLSGCSTDLFHDTSWQDYCEENPTAQVCEQGDSGTDSSTGIDGDLEGGVTKDSAMD